MEMFNKKVLDERIGYLKKSKILEHLEDVEGYYIRKCKENDIEHSYDVMAEEMPYFKTLGYTEYATCFIGQPLNLKVRLQQIRDAWNDEDHEVLDWCSYFKDIVLKKDANKYQDRRTDLSQFEIKDNIVVLPGSNKLKSNVCLQRLLTISRQNKGKVYFKPHPITKHELIGELKDHFGEDAVLHRDHDLYYFLKKAKKVYSTHISESALYAAVLGKKFEPIDVWNIHHQGSFHHINDGLYDNRYNVEEWINKVFSSPKSGIINPAIDKNWKEKVDKYFDYILVKRNFYKDWYIDTRKPKKK
jgi:hypothetical protein